MSDMHAPLKNGRLLINIEQRKTEHYWPCASLINMYESFPVMAVAESCPGLKSSRSSVYRPLDSAIKRNPKVIWEEPCRHPSRQIITTSQSPHRLQRDAPHLFPKLPLPFFDDLHPI